MHSPLGSIATAIDDNERAAARQRMMEVFMAARYKVARWQNVMPFFAWIAPGCGGRGGAIQVMEGIKFCRVT